MVEQIVDSMRLPTAAERRREALVHRLACALEDMADLLPADDPVRVEAATWKGRTDLEHLLDVWEAGVRAGQRAAG